MKALELYNRMEKDFDLAHSRDDWSRMEFNEYISENYKKRYMGLMIDNTPEIRKVYTAVFPSDRVIKKILSIKEKNILLFIHHPMIWDIRKAPKVFSDIPAKFFSGLRKNQISIYNLHMPLDRNGPYSTTTSFAKALGIIPESEFAEYFGVKAGLFGKTSSKTVKELADKFESAVGHRVRLWNYGDKIIRKGKVALIAGGGNDVDALREINIAGINTLLTGCTLLNDHSRAAHEFAKKNKINLLGGTHYSTEKFACIAICDYFKRLGLPSEFIEDKPVMEDL